MAIASLELERGIVSTETSGAEIEIDVPPRPIENPAYTVRPINPLFIPSHPGEEPAYGTVSAKEWELYVARVEEHNEALVRRNIAERFAEENDLRGVPFS